MRTTEGEIESFHRGLDSVKIRSTPLSKGPHEILELYSYGILYQVFLIENKLSYIFW